jgi:uncharacterized protein involved in exopolysaccharide biosynthesis
MMVRLVEAFFRHWLLLLTPPVLIPLIVGPIAVLTTPVYYESWVGVWVERPAYLSYSDGWNNYATPAQNQNRLLGEVLRTRSFVNDVALKTSLAPFVGTDRGEEAIQRAMARSFSAWPTGDSLLVLRFRAATPELSFEVVNAVVEAFKNKLAADRVNQASLAISFYEEQLKTSEDQMAKASEAMRRYVAANPRLAAVDPERGTPLVSLPTAAVDPQLAALVNRMEVEQAGVERVRSTLERARLEAAAALEGQELGFQVVDPAKVPTKPIRERRRRLIYPAAGLLVGLGVSTATLVLLVAGDRTVRLEHDLPPGIPVLGSVPRLRLPRAHSNLATARGAIGAIAGAALPALPPPSEVS